MSFGIGQPVPRSEDPRFLTGRGQYVDDINLPRQTHAAFLYSPHAHANIKSIDASAAKNAPGVLLVLTGADVEADGLGALPTKLMPEDVGGPPGYRTEMAILAQGRVRFVGERVAMVVAGTEAQARDAVELIKVDYEELPAIVSVADAIADGAPQIYEGAPNNKSFTMRMGHFEGVDDAFAKAAHVTKLNVYNNRVTANPMEMRSVIADYNPGQDKHTLYTSTQNPHGIRQDLASRIFHKPEHKFRVVSPDVGGGFGMKGAFFPEEAALSWAALKLGRPVKWVPSRSEAILTDYMGRDITFDGELALDKDGKIMAMRWTAYANTGAYIASDAAVVLMSAVMMSQGTYVMPILDVTGVLVFTNLTPCHPYRGAGRPEAIFYIERILDKAARELGIDPAEIRRRNLIAPDAMPFHTHTHAVFDSGEFVATLDKCVAASDEPGYVARKKASESKGRLRGRGLVYYIDNTGIFNERMEIRFDPSGSATIVSGTFSHGQGHETSYKQVVNEYLGVPFEQINFIQGDTDAVSYGRGTYGSRSMLSGGSALKMASDRIIEKGKAFAGMALEASPSDIEFADGMFTVTGTDKAMPIGAVAQFSFIPMGLPDEMGVGLEATGTFDGAAHAYPNGAHICEVEIDPETGKVYLDKYTVVDDVGNVINPLLAEGQIHGGIAQGVGQALLEDIKYDKESGQLLTGSFLDYCMPRADDLPSYDCDWNPVPCKTNAIGAKGAGEGGTVAAVPAVINAIVDALAPYDVADIPMPATPEVVWRAINGGRSKAA